MTIVRLNQHCESLDRIIEGLENGSRTLSPAETAQLLRQLTEALEATRTVVTDTVPRWKEVNAISI